MQEGINIQTPATPTPVIWVAHDRLVQAVLELDQIIKDLLMKLQPVLTPMDDPDEQPGDPDGPATSELASAINARTSQIEELTYVVRDIYLRVEL